MRARASELVHRLAIGRHGIILALVWGVAEALFWPIFPDFLVLAVVPAAPKRWWKLAVAASVGSVLGGAAGYLLARLTGSSSMLNAMPLVTAGMVTQAETWIAAEGWLGVLRQPLSGIPYKVFVYLSGAKGVGFPGFVWASALARGIRLLAAAGLAALFGMAFAKLLARWYGVFLALFSVVFAVALAQVVARFGPG